MISAEILRLDKFIEKFTFSSYSVEKFKFSRNKRKIDNEQNFYSEKLRKCFIQRSHLGDAVDLVYVKVWGHSGVNFLFSKNIIPQILLPLLLCIFKSSSVDYQVNVKAHSAFSLRLHISFFLQSSESYVSVLYFQNVRLCTLTFTPTLAAVLYGDPGRWCYLVAQRLLSAVATTPRSRLSVRC